MQANNLEKVKLKNSLKVKLEDLGQSFKILNTTRTIYVVVVALFSIKVILLDVLFGPFAEWMNISANSYTSSGLSMGLVIFGFIIFSIPRLIGNLNFIIKLKRTSLEMNDQNFNKAYRCQRIRLLVYFFIILLFSILASHILNRLNSYYIETRQFADLSMILSDIQRFPAIIGFTEQILVIIFFYVVLSLIEKFVNYLTWFYLNKWIKYQNVDVKNKSASKILWDMETGANLTRYSIFLMMIESLSGNIVFNFGLHKISQGFKYYPLDYVQIVPLARYSSYRTSSSSYTPRSNTPSYQKPLYNSVRTNEIPYRPTTTHSSLQQNLQTTVFTPSFCGYCGKKLYYPNSQFCSNCGSRIQ